MPHPHQRRSHTVQLAVCRSQTCVSRLRGGGGRGGKNGGGGREAGGEHLMRADKGICRREGRRCKRKQGAGHSVGGRCRREEPGIGGREGGEEGRREV